MFARRRVVLFVTLALALAVLPFALIFLKPTYIATAHVVMVGKDSMIPSGDMAMLTTSPAVLARVASRFSLGADLSSLMSRIDAKVAVRSNVMPISYRDKDQTRSRDVTNALADETVAYYKELSGGQYDQMIAFLRKSAGLERDEIRTTDLALQRAAQHDIYVGSDTALETITARINELRTERSSSYATLVSDEAIAAAQSAQPHEIAGIVKQEVLFGDPYVQALRAGHARDAAQLQFQRAQFTDRFPGLPSLQDQVERERAVLTAAESTAVAGSPSSSAAYAATMLAKRSALAVAAGDRARVAAVDHEIATQEAHLRDLPGTGSTVTLLRAERDGARASYSGTIARLAQTQADQAAAASLGSVALLDHAADAGPRIPRIAMDCIVAFLLLALTITVGFVFDILDPSLRSPEAIEKLYGIPVIGNLGSR
jgi:capsular polysaccharide biosynthesis protein